jgi:hypothetical protein
MTIDVQSSEKEGTKDYEAVKQAIELARRSGGVWRSELTKIPGGRDLSRWGTRMCHHPDWEKGHKLISTQHTDDQ